jgi:hypothetical protein
VPPSGGRSVYRPQGEWKGGIPETERVKSANILGKGGLGMKKMIAATAVLVTMVTWPGFGYLAAQQMGGQMPMMGQSGQQGQPTDHPPVMGRGMMGGGMTGEGMMGMMPGMMGGQMGCRGMGIMGMMASGQVDPKTMAKILQFRGEMLKAMGEVMMKHSKAMEEAK